MSGTHAYSVCRGKQGAIRSRREQVCHSRYLLADQLDELVWQDVCEVLQHPEIIEQALRRALSGEWLSQELQARSTQLRKARANLNGQLERLTEAYLAEVLPLAEYKRRRQEMEQRLAALESQAHQMESSVQQQMKAAAVSRSVTDFCQRVRLWLATGYL